MNLIEYIGWTGSILLAFCALPQAIDSWKKGSSEGITWGLIVMWGLGEVFTLIYVMPKKELPLLVNYSLNIAFLFVVLYYKVKPNKRASQSGK